jgi:hypothetical protein
MKWLPGRDMWLTYMRVDARAGDLDYDLAVDASGYGQPSPVAAGLVGERSTSAGATAVGPVVAGLLVIAVVLVAGAVAERRRIGRPAI